MDTPRIHTFKTREEAAKNLARSLAEECLDTKRPVLLLFSGGSALSVIDHLPVYPDASFLTLSVVDERDDPSKKQSNFQELKRTLWFQKMIAGGASFIDPLEDIHLPTEEKALAVERAFRQWKDRYGNGSVIALLGMGADGHTAGIFPMKTEKTFRKLFRGDAWVVSHIVPGAPSYPKRITATLTFLQQEVQRVYVFICGEEKKPIWRKLLAEDNALHTLPLLCVYKMHQADIFTDLESELPAQKD